MNVRNQVPKYVQDMSKDFPGNSQEMSGQSPGNVQQMSMKFPRILQDNPRDVHKRSRKLPEEIWGKSKGVGLSP